MKRGKKQQNTIITSLEIFLIPIIIILGNIFHLRHAFLVPLVTVLFIISGAAALWAKANRHADGSEWWQDDENSGW